MHERIHYDSPRRYCIKNTLTNVCVLTSQKVFASLERICMDAFLENAKMRLDAEGHSANVFLGVSPAVGQIFHLFLHLHAYNT